MKKVIGILLVLVLIFVGYYIFANAEMVNNETIDGMVYNESWWTAKEMLNDWMSMYRSNVKIDSIDEKGYATVTGVIEYKEFEEEQGVACTFENMEKIIREHYDISYFKISNVGTYGLYSIKKKKKKSESEPIGYVYNENNEKVDFYEGCIYFMVVYNEE